MQPTTWIAISGAIPALVAMWLVDRLDAKRPEPAKTRRMVAFAGMLSVIPALVLEIVLSNTVGETIPPQLTYQGSSFHAFVVAAAVEEACKILVVYWVVWKRPEFDERMDGIVYAGRAGLGFALVENVLYLLHQGSVGGEIQVWIMRAVLAVPGHAMWTGMIGAMAARRRFDGKGLGLIGGYLLAVAFHGAYDFCVFVQQPLHLEGHATLQILVVPALVALTIAAFFTLRTMARRALVLDDLDVENRSRLKAAPDASRLNAAPDASRLNAAPDASRLNAAPDASRLKAAPDASRLNADPDAPTRAALESARSNQRRSPR